jgi:FG-GAP-like repeat
MRATPNSHPIFSHGRAHGVSRCVSPILSCLFAYSGSASAQIAFQAKTAMATGTSPSAVAVGDFNGDRKQDIAVTVDSNNRVYIYSGNGDGTFSFAISYVVGSQPVAIAAVDLNHDGKLDLAVVNRQSATVSVLIGNGDSTFAPAVGYAVGSLPVSIAAASYDPDGFVDLVTANRGDVCGPPFNPCGTVSLLRNNGDGTFHAGATLYPGVVPDTIAAGIFTAGGDTDFVVTSFTSSEFLVYLGDGGGAFPTVKGPLTTLSASVVLVADFDGDGNADVAISRASSGDVSLQHGKGDGTFDTAAIYSEGVVGAHPYSGATADFDGDDHSDVAFANYSDNTIAVLRTRTVGNGGFDGALTFSGGLNGPGAIASGDFNHDGKPDLVVVNTGGDSITVFLNASIPIDRIFLDGFDFN